MTRAICINAPAILRNNPNVQIINKIAISVQITIDHLVSAREFFA